MKKLLALILALVMCFSLVACGGDKDDAKADGKPAASDKPVADKPADKPADSDSDEEPIRILYAVTALSATYFQDSFKAFKPIFEENGFVTAMDAPPSPFSAEGQLAHLENAITSGEWDVLLVYAGVPEALKTIVPLADEYGVKVIGYCQDATTNMGHIYYGTSTSQQGEMCAQMAIDYVDAHPELYEDLDKIPYAIMANWDNPQLLARNTKTKEVLDADGRFEMVYEQKCTGMEGAYAWAENLITTNPDVKFMLGASDTEALGVMEAFKTAGYGDDESIGIFSHDCVAESQDSIRNGGILRGSGYAPYEVIAENIIDIARKLVAGESFDEDNMPYIHCYGVMQDNIDEFFPQ